MPEEFITPSKAQQLQDIRETAIIGQEWSLELPTPARPDQRYEEVDISAVI